MRQRPSESGDWGRGCSRVWALFEDGGGGGAEEIDVGAIDLGKPLTRSAVIEIKVAKVREPLASAVKIVQNGKRMVLDANGSYIENESAGERMEVRVMDDTFVVNVQFETGDVGCGEPPWCPHRRAQSVRSQHNGDSEPRQESHSI